LEEANMPITAQYDDEADALYVRLAAGERVRTITIDETTYIDLDVAGRTIGIELLYPSMGIDFVALARKLSLEQQLPQIIAAVLASAAPVALPTFTGGGSLISYMTTTVAAEGAVPASHGGHIISGVTYAARYQRQPSEPTPA
jgi:uncharacterized protein YuzE